MPIIDITKLPITIPVSSCQQCHHGCLKSKATDDEPIGLIFTQTFSPFCEELNAFLDVETLPSDYIHKDCPLEKKDSNDDQRLYVWLTSICPNYEPDEQGTCCWYDDLDVAPGCTVDSCKYHNNLVQYIPDCPMSIEKCSEPEDL